MDKVDTQEKRKYIKSFFVRFSEDDEFNTVYSKAFGPWSTVLTIEDHFNPSDDILIGDMYFDLGMNPYKVFYYSKNRVDRMYSALRLVEINKSVKILGYLAFAVTRLKKFFAL